MANRVSVFCCSKKYNPFILKVNSGADSNFTIPTLGGGYNYDLRVQGGQVWYGLTGNHTINFPSANTDYFIEISGEFPRIYFNNTGDRLKLLDRMQFGDVVFESLQGAFNGCENALCSATDPKIKSSSLSSINSAFRNNRLIEDHPSIDYSELTNAVDGYNGAWEFNPQDFDHELELLADGFSMHNSNYKFNPPNYTPTLASLNRGVYMHYNNYLFNPLGYAPTLESLTQGMGMYFGCRALNPIGWKPNLAKALNLNQFLGETHAFNQDISGWNMSKCEIFFGFKAHSSPTTSSLTHDILLDDPVTGTLAAVDIRGIFRNNKSDKIAMQCGNVELIDSFSFQSTYTTKLILIDLPVAIDISLIPNLLGVNIDNLADSVKDWTGATPGTGPVVTMTEDQYLSGIDTDKWNDKIWDINVIY